MSVKTILIWGGGLQAVSSARSLKERGFRVGQLIAHKDYSSKSKALDFCIEVSDVNDADKLAEILNENEADVVIPMSDSNALFLSKHKTQLLGLSNCAIPVPDYECMQVASDKLQLMEFCKKNGFPHPQTLRKDDNIDYKLENLDFPILIKPNHSVGARGITKAKDAEELKKLLPRIEEKYGECHIQEYIDGNLPYYNVMIYRNSKGNIINSVILEIIRFYPIEGGSSCLCKTIENNKLTEICKNVLEALNYVGFADFDVLQTKTGEYKIIEINPRVPASLRGAAISGVNFPALIVSEALNEKYNGGSYVPGKFLRYLGLDIMWFLSSPKRFKASPSWFKFFGKNVFYQEGGMEDLNVIVASLLGNLNKLTFEGGRLRKKPT